MKTIKLFLTLLILSAGPALMAAEGTTDTNAAIRKELREVRAMLAEIKAELAELKNQMKALRPSEEPTRPKGPDLKALQKIKLPENPTDDQVREYIDSIITASEGQRIWSGKDPQVRMLAQLGRERLKLIIDALEPGDFHLIKAIEQLATEADKQLIIDELRKHHGLVKIILREGWERDAKDTLVRVLATRPRSLPTEWIKAVARLKDPKTYDDLKAYFLEGLNPHYTYKALVDLPNFDLAGAVAEAWDFIKDYPSGPSDSMGYERKKTVAIIAVGYGHLDALEFLVKQQPVPQENSWTYKSIRHAILRHSDLSGTKAEIADSFEKHKHLLVFDSEKKKFVVVKDGKDAESTPAKTTSER